MMILLWGSLAMPNSEICLWHVEQAFIFRNEDVKKAKLRERAALFFTGLGLLSPLSNGALQLYYTIVFVNCMLFVFNLIPIPPLDGSHVLKHAISMKEETYRNLAKYGFVILIVLINIPPFQNFMWTTIAFCCGLFGVHFK